MPPTSLCFTLSLYFLSKLVPVLPYSYQTKPLFLSFSDLAALEANSLHQPNSPRFVADRRLKTFAVKCHEDSIEVVMKAYLFDPGRPVEPTRLRLGPVRAARDHCTARESGNGEYVIRAALAECGSRVMFTRSSVLYNNLLLYSPPPPSPGDAMQAAAVPVQCEYDRRYTVSSRALKPTWSPPISIQSAHLDLDFHLRLMTNDWSSERRSSVYFLGDVMNIEAAVDHPHPPLRVYADSCVATLTSDATSYPRYAFVDHQGCFTDSQLDGSSSRFLPRVHDQLLHIQLQPFLFHQDHRHTVSTISHVFNISTVERKMPQHVSHCLLQMYITCYLEAEPVSNKEPVKRACSVMGGRWRSVDGDDRVCESCSSGAKSNHRRALRSKTKPRHSELHRETTVGPVIFLPLKLTATHISV